MLIDLIFAIIVCSLPILFGIVIIIDERQFRKEMMEDDE